MASTFNEIFFYIFSAFKVWHQRSKTGQATLAAEYGSKILKFYENFFGIKYPFSKVDFVAVPNFSSQPMGNWGVMTFSQDVLLADARFASTQFKENLVKVSNFFLNNKHMNFSKCSWPKQL